MEAELAARVRVEEERRRRKEEEGHRVAREKQKAKVAIPGPASYCLAYTLA